MPAGCGNPHRDVWLSILQRGTGMRVTAAEPDIGFQEFRQLRVTLMLTESQCSDRYVQTCSGDDKEFERGDCDERIAE